MDSIFPKESMRESPWRSQAVLLLWHFTGDSSTCKAEIIEEKVNSKHIVNVSSISSSGTNN